MPEILGGGFEIPTRHFWLLLDRERRGWEWGRGDGEGRVEEEDKCEGKRRLRKGEGVVVVLEGARMSVSGCVRGGKGGVGDG